MKLSGSVLLFYGEHLWEHVEISARVMEKFSERFSKEDYIELLKMQLEELYREREGLEHLARYEWAESYLAQIDREIGAVKRVLSQLTAE